MSETENMSLFSLVELAMKRAEVKVQNVASILKKFTSLRDLANATPVELIRAGGNRFDLEIAIKLKNAFAELLIETDKKMNPTAITPDEHPTSSVETTPTTTTKRKWTRRSPKAAKKNESIAQIAKINFLSEQTLAASMRLLPLLRGLDRRDLSGYDWSTAGLNEGLIVLIRLWIARPMSEDELNAMIPKHLSADTRAKLFILCTSTDLLQDQNKITTLSEAISFLGTNLMK